MKKLIKILISAAVLAIIAFSAMFISFNYINGTDDNGKPNKGNLVRSNIQEPDITIEPYTEPIINDDADNIKISKNAKIFYEYIYPDGKTVKNEEEAPYFMIGLTEKELTEIYYGWDLVAFSQDIVILQKQLQAGSDRYIVGIKDGYVAVFYNTTQSDSLKEITTTPVGSLSPDEQIKLKEGIYVSGRDNLIKLLEDYGS